MRYALPSNEEKVEGPAAVARLARRPLEQGAGHGALRLLAAGWGAAVHVYGAHRAGGAL